MNILVIGGAGYIGSHVARELLDNGYGVTIYDNFSSGKEENVFADEDLVRGDVLNFDLLDKTMGDRKFDGIIHLSAFKAAGESMVIPEKYSVNNICGTINILNAAVKNGVKKIIFSSTAAVYGEPQYLPIDENHPTNPENYYGFTKLEIERILTWYDKLKGLKFVALRYFNAAGYDKKGRISGLETNPQNLLPIVMETAVGKREKITIFGSDWDTRDGTCVRDYIHVSDLASAHLKAFEYLLKVNESLTVNLGSQTGVSVKEMVDTARKITGRKIEAEFGARRDGDPSVVLATAKKAKEALGFKAQHSDITSLILTTWEVYKKNFKI
ncbi:MAG: UDP-glucose 4-epimerase GalE [Chitinispirillales bacterium]|jgi:UDP-glucose 4-epimerase|nr:UDP-glucose 4-epimerase GalE [Chitinispirillales bacterium]